MKAAIYTRYGPPEVLSIHEIAKPEPKDNEILIKIHATAVNSADCRLRRADPPMVRLMFGLFRPRIQILGLVFSGEVESVGSAVTKYKVGDEVFGLTEMDLGSYAEYKCIDENGPFSLKPHNLSHIEAASIPFGAHTALHFIKKLNLSSESKVLVYGASGAVGSAVVQIAKKYGANVTAVCSDKNVDLMREIGADEVIDYTVQDISELDKQYDVAFETVNKTPVAQIAKLVIPGGTLILGAVIIKGAIQGAIAARKHGIKFIAGEAKVNANDMLEIKALVEDGYLKPVIDKIYELEQIVEAHKYVEHGHKRGNVVIEIVQS